MTDAQTTIRALKDLVLAFSKERNWEQFHHPKDLGVALACEVGEVLELFRYKTNDEILKTLDDPAQRRDLAHELADCLWVLLRLSDVSGIDLAASLLEKVELAALKYPVDQSYGRSDKYNRYQTSEGISDS